MSNLLTPPGLVRATYRKEFIPDTYDSRTDPMPTQPGSWIRTDRGYRRLQLDEIGRGLGLLKVGSKTAAPGLLQQTTSVFHWEYLSELLTERHRGPMAAPKAGRTKQPSTASTTGPDTERAPFAWQPPDLSPEGKWYRQRLANLSEAIKECPDPKQAWQDGLAILRIHRGNYNTEGPKPKRLQVLWWEFPREHWTGLRDGSRMNFLKVPESRLNVNANMDEEQLQVAAAFVDELIGLGVVDTLDEGQDILLNAPLFVVPKEGQDGEWRVIADMLRGGQNMCIGNDPVVLPRMSHILEQLYEGGYSAVVDTPTTGNAWAYFTRSRASSMPIAAFQWGRVPARDLLDGTVSASFASSKPNTTPFVANARPTAGGPGSLNSGTTQNLDMGLCSRARMVWRSRYGRSLMTS
jgi:hypothetical protein